MCSPRIGLLILFTVMFAQGCVSPYRSTYNFPYGQGRYNQPGYAPVITNPPNGMPPSGTYVSPTQPGTYAPPGTFMPGTPTPLPSTDNNAPPYVPTNPGGNSNSPIPNPFPAGNNPPVNNGNSTYPVPVYEEPMKSSIPPTSQKLPMIVPENQPNLIPASAVSTSSKTSFDQLPVADSPPVGESDTVIKPASNKEDDTKFERPVTVDQQADPFSTQPASPPVSTPAPLKEQPAKPTETLPDIVPFTFESTTPQSSNFQKIKHESTISTTTSTSSTTSTDNQSTSQPASPTLMKLAYDGDSMRWIQGILSYNPARQSWEVQYSRTPDPNDPHKGRINLVSDPRLNKLKPQDLVQVEGQVTRMNNGLEYYQITNISRLDPSYQ